MSLIFLLAKNFISTLKSLLLLLPNCLALIITSILVINLMLTFNRQLFYTLVNILAYIINYAKNKK